MENQLSDIPEDIIEIASDDGAAFKIRRAGNLNGVRLLLSHGNGFAIDGYRVFWEPLLSDFEVILFDMRNHGRNDPVGADRHSYFQMARDLGVLFHEINSRLGKKKNVGVFHSMSARAAMKHAVQMEWVWDALILFDPPNVPPPGHPQYESMRNFELKLSQWAVNREQVFSSPNDLSEFWEDSRAQLRWHAQAREDMAKAVLRPDGESFLKLDKKPGEFVSIDVPTDMDGKLWRLHQVAGTVCLMNVPPYVARLPEELLLPAAVIRNARQE